MDHYVDVSHSAAHIGAAPYITIDHIDDRSLGVLKRCDIERANGMPPRQKKAAEVDSEEARSACDQVTRRHKLHPGSPWKGLTGPIMPSDAARSVRISTYVGLLILRAQEGGYRVPG